MASLVKCARSALARAIHTQPATPGSADSALQLIRSQPSQYVVATFAGKKYILAPRDVLTVPRLRDVKVGDVLLLDKIHELGSRDYTLRGDPVISPERVKVDATIIEHTKGSLETKFKKKRRKGYQKTIKNKHPYTRLRIGSIEIPIAT
ncbi:ribosomal protein L21-like protein [Amanita rubescens]|nr:ribosomal protein L21-like protein [Amanita rubescens]